MAGIVLSQPNGVGTLNAAGAQHPAPVDIDVGEICQLSFSGSTRIYRWTLSKPSGSASVLSSGNSAGPSFMPDVDGGSYSVSLIDSDEVEYILDIVTPTTGSGGGSGGGGSSVSVAIEDYSSVRAASFAGGSPPSTFVVMRRSDVGDGGEGTFVLLEGDTTSDDDDGILLVDSDGNRFRRVFSGAIDARWFGVVAYPTLAEAQAGTNSYTSLLAATRSVSSIANATAHMVVLPYGFIRCDSMLEISRSLLIKGHGKQSTVIVFPGASANGIEIRHSETSSDGGDGSGSTLEDFSVWASSTTGNVDGIYVNANNVTLNRVDSLYFGRWGYQIFGSVPGNQGNANDWKMNGCSSWHCGQGGSGDDRGGLYVHGNDSSAGVNIGFRGLEVTGIGIREESFLGNKHDGCHVEIATGVSYQTRQGQVSRSTFVDCYAEGAQPIKMYYPNCWLGGYPGTGFSSDSDGLILLDSNGTFPFGVSNRESGTDSAVFYVGDYSNALGSGVKNAVFGWAADGMAVSTENYSLFWDTTSFQWNLRRHATDSASSMPFWITGWGHSRPHSHLGTHSLLLDDVRITAGSSAPSSGLWRKGDRLVNSSPAAGSAKEWICTTAGGWGSAWQAVHIYTNHEVVAPTSPNGYVYEMVSYNSGTSAGSEPTWPTTPGDTVSDNGMTWKNVGVTPAVFEAIYSTDDQTIGAKSVAAGGTITLTDAESAHARIKFTGSPGGATSVVVAAGGATGWTRTFWNAASEIVTVKASGGDTGVPIAPAETAIVFSDGTNARYGSYPTEQPGNSENIAVRNLPYFFDATRWSVDEYGTVSSISTAGDSAVYALELPDGCTLNGVTAYVIGGGNVALPAVMPRFRVRTLRMSDGNQSATSASVDASANVGAYNAAHTISASSLGITVDNVVNRYTIEFVSESGANATSGYQIYGIICGVLINTPARSAA